jgi:hypothetical protein
MEDQAEFCADILKIIRDRSETGRLLRAEEILTQLKGQGIFESEAIEPKTHLETLLKHVLQENRDLREISGRNGIAYYHSVQSLSETYAGILVWKSEDPLWLIAEVVRTNSQLYPRPVSLDSLREPPFGLTREEIAECLAFMGEHREYQDIAQTVTSIGTPFLYSTQHLDPDHASTLAEWLDVGQVNNP